MRGFSFGYENDGDSSEVEVNKLQMELTWSMLSRKPILRAAFQVIENHIFCGDIELGIRALDGTVVEKMKPDFKKSFNRLWTPFLKDAMKNKLCFGFIPFKIIVDKTSGMRVPRVANPGTYSVLKRTSPFDQSYLFLRQGSDTGNNDDEEITSFSHIDICTRLHSLKCMR